MLRRQRNRAYIAALPMHNRFVASAANNECGKESAPSPVLTTPFSGCGLCLRRTLEGFIKVAAKPHEGEALLIDFTRSADAGAPQKGQRRTPALDGVLQ
jgi:hypothetical protein